MQVGLQGNLLPGCEAEFADNAKEMRTLSCVNCGAGFCGKNVHTKMGWQETQISGFCENCYDEMFKED